MYMIDLILVIQIQHKHVTNSHCQIYVGDMTVAHPEYINWSIFITACFTVEDKQ